MRIDPRWPDSPETKGKNRCRRLLAASLVAMAVGVVAPLEGGEEYITEEAERAEAAIAGQEKKKDSDIVVAPIPIVNPTLGYGLNLSNIDVEWVHLEDQEGNPELTGNIDIEVNDVSIYARIRF